MLCDQQYLQQVVLWKNEHVEHSLKLDEGE
jgi:hypothetical protein